MKEMSSAQQEAAQRAATEFAHSLTSSELRARAQRDKRFTIPDREDNFAEGTDPGFSTIDEVPMSTEDAAYFKAKDEAKHKALVAKIKADWEADHAKDAPHRAEVGKITNLWQQEEFDHAEEARDNAAQWQKDDTEHAADVARAKGVWQADTAVQLKAAAEQVERVMRVEKEIKDNPTGPLAKLRAQVRKILGGNR